MANARDRMVFMVRENVVMRFMVKEGGRDSQQCVLGSSGRGCPGVEQKMSRLLLRLRQVDCERNGCGREIAALRQSLFSDNDVV
mgnify:CR=1 FL=1